MPVSAAKRDVTGDNIRRRFKQVSSPDPHFRPKNYSGFRALKLSAAAAPTGGTASMEDYLIGRRD
jgi:hypothetical protein